MTPQDHGPTAGPAPARPGRRKQMLVKPGIQLRLSGIFAGLTIVCLLIQWLLFSALLTNAAHSVPVGGEYLLDLVPTLLFRSILFSLLIALPVTLLAGVHATHRITGPIHRFEAYLREVIRGTQLGPCKIRSGDALDELCGLINEATEPVRRRTAGVSSVQDGPAGSDKSAA